MLLVVVVVVEVQSESEIPLVFVGCFFFSSEYGKEGKTPQHPFD